MADNIGARTLRELTRVIFAQLGIVVAIVAVITVGTLVACLAAHKHYRSSVTFLVKEPRPQNPTAQEVSTDRSLEVFIKTQHELIKSETVLARTLAVLDSPESPAARNWRSARQAWQRDDSQENWDKLLASLEDLDAEIEQRKNYPETGGEFRDAIRRFARRVKTETPGGEAVALTEIFTVTVTQPAPPKNAKRAAALLAENYKDRYREVQVRSSREAAEFMRARLQALRRDQLGPAEDRLREFVEHELESPADLVILEQLTRSGTEAGRQIIVRRFQEDMISLDAGLAEARQLRQQLLEQLPRGLWDGQQERDEDGNLTVPDLARLDEARLPDDDPILTDIVTIIPEETLKYNVVVNTLKSKEVALLIDLNRLKVEYKPDYPSVRDKLTEIARTRRQILRELIGEATALDIKNATLSARQREIGRRLEEEQRRLDSITPKLVRYQELQHEVNLAREQYGKLSGDLTTALNLQEQEAGAITISIVDQARLPDVRRPAYPNTGLYTLLAALVGLLLATAYAFAADYFDHTLRSIEETERYLGVPAVGSVGKHGQGLLT